MPDPLDDFDFDRWALLASDDPEAFERERRAAVESLIAAAPPGIRQRLAGLQWQADQERHLAATPMAACIRLSHMMWDRVAGDDGLLEALSGLTDAAGGPRPAREAAKVLPFEPSAPGEDPPV